jgi:hypothetical protein
LYDLLGVSSAKYLRRKGESRDGWQAAAEEYIFNVMSLQKALAVVQML